MTLPEARRPVVVDHRPDAGAPAEARVAPPKRKAPKKPSFPSLTDQVGLATRRQLRRVGWSEAAIRHRLIDRWQLLLPGVVAPHRQAVDEPTMLVAAQLWAGKNAVLSGLAGLSVLGLKHDTSLNVARLLVPDSQRRREAHRVESVRTDRPPTGTRRVGIHTVASASRCLVDASAWDLDTAEARMALTISALQQGIVGREQLRRELLYARRNDTAGVAKGLEAYEAGAWSRPEAVLAEVLAGSQVLSTFRPNPQLRVKGGRRLPTPDAYVEEVGLAIQVHSKRYHSRDADWEGTVEGDNALTRVGIVVIGVTPKTLYDRPGSFLADAEQTCLSLRGRPLPDVVIERRTP